MLSNRWNVIAWCVGLSGVLLTACLPEAAEEAPSSPAAAGSVQAEAPPDVPASGAPALDANPDREEPEITLTIGQPAPPLAVGAWVKGERIERLKSGQVSVVEFWATWCGPCLAGMPHLSKLQTDYGTKVRIIGISREDEGIVREFLAKEREEGVTWDQKVSYSLAMDSGNTMNTTWFRAAGRTGIPSAFLVGRDGVIEWIGHPARIDEPLAKVIDGTWDRSAAIAEYEGELRELKAAAALRRASPALTRALRDEDWPRAIAILDELIQDIPDSPQPRLKKLSILGQSGKTEEALRLMHELVQSDWDKGAMLSTIAGGIVAARFPGTLDEAEGIAKRAVELSQEKGLGQLHVLASVYAEQGRLDDAIKWEKKALEQAGRHALIERTLERYEERKKARSRASENGPK